MASNGPELQNSFELLKEDLECPVCMDVPESLPIYQCLQGHIICNVCCGQLPGLSCWSIPSNQSFNCGEDIAENVDRM